MSDRPNVVLVLTDQHRGDCVGADPHSPTVDGRPVLQTPNLDHLAEQGVLFARHYSPAPMSLPARRCLWTGQTPATSDSTGWNTDDWAFDHTLPGLLTDAGYQSRLVGKTHSRPRRNHFGFEHVDLHDGLSPTYYNSDPDDYSTWLREETGGAADEEIAHGIGVNTVDARPWHRAEEEHPTRWTTDRALEFLDARDPTRPFFLTVSYHRPHNPYDPPRAYWERYADRDLPAPARGDWADDLYGDLRPSFLGRTPNAWCKERPPEVVDRIRAGYYGLVNHVDAQLHRIIERLQRGGELSNTLILMTSDHGDMLGDHALWYKSYAYEGSARIPLLVRFPDAWEVPRGRRVDLPTGLEDLLPTLLDVIDEPIPDAVEGRSLLPILEDPDRDSDGWRRYYHGELDRAYHPENGCQWLVDDRTKYVWNPLTGDDLLFDLERDPLEETDRSDDPDYRETLEAFRDRLAARLADRPEGFSDGERLVPLDR